MANIVEYREIPIRQVVAQGNGKFSVRRGDWTQTDAFIELRDSIERYGQIEPIGVVLLESENFNARYSYEVLYGFRRYMALKQLSERSGEDCKIKVLVYEGDCVPDTRVYQTIQALTAAPLEPPDLAQVMREISDRKDPPIIAGDYIPDWVAMPKESPDSPGEKFKVIGYRNRICPKCQKRVVRHLKLERDYYLAQCLPVGGANCGFVFYKI